MGTSWIALVAGTLLVTPAVMAADTPQAFGSMVVTGTIVVHPDGSVAGYTLDKQDRLPAPVVADIAKVVPQWKFQPVTRDGKAVTAKSHMSVRMLAEPIAGGKYAIMVGGAHFGQCAPGTCVSYKDAPPPKYPPNLHGTTVAGTAYLILQVGRDGTVQHAAVREVDLQVKGNEWQMKRWRHALAQSSLDAARQWTFNPPVKGANVAADHWMATVPVHYRVPGRYQPQYGQWHSYLPGPRNFIPWLGEQVVAGGSIDALPGNGLYPLQQSLHLLTQTGGSRAHS